ncbi:MAG: DUF4399 domain-containing protein [Ardenticatenaceae bacterium]|nr:DUF4399 domain-containing protein [Ardenticatenaceae bacterium]HBY93070.1 hypothetical protein [Chloroflexota bacterium]
MKSIVEVLRATGLAVVLVVLIVGIGFAQGNPTVKFEAPQNGATVGPDVTLKWTSSGATIVSAKDAKEKTEAHFHVFVDKQPSLQAGQAIPADDPQIIHTGATSLDLTGLAPGAHTATVVLGYADHTPWEPFTMDTVNFTVAAPATLPATGGTRLVLTLMITAVGLVLLASAGVLRWRRS